MYDAESNMNAKWKNYVSIQNGQSKIMPITLQWPDKVKTLFSTINCVQKLGVNLKLGELSIDI